MKKLPINFFQEDISYNLREKTKIRSWINATILAENHLLEELNFIFCSDDYLLQINQQYLNHDTYTDIITFDNAEQENYIKGDIFISIDRVRENARDFGASVQMELCRVIIHGTLHLLGYPDKKTPDKKRMTEKEDFYLSRLPSA